MKECKVKTIYTHSKSSEFSGQYKDFCQRKIDKMGEYIEQIEACKFNSENLMNIAEEIENTYNSYLELPGTGRNSRQEKNVTEENKVQERNTQVKTGKQGVSCLICNIQ